MQHVPSAPTIELRLAVRKRARAALSLAGERIPTLEEVAAELPSGVRLVADFKHGEERFPGITQRVAAFARAFGPARFAVLSIRHALPTTLADLVPGLLPLLTYRAALATVDELRELAALPPSLGLGSSLRALSAALLVVARESGRPVCVFNPNTESELRVALTIGVDGHHRPDRRRPRSPRCACRARVTPGQAFAWMTIPLADIHTFAGFDQIRAWEEAYLPSEELMKYEDSVGHQPGRK